MDCSTRTRAERREWTLVYIYRAIKHVQVLSECRNEILLSREDFLAVKSQERLVWTKSIGQRDDLTLERRE